jgi:hypothetical protein
MFIDDVNTSIVYEANQQSRLGVEGIHREECTKTK